MATFLDDAVLTLARQVSVTGDDEIAVHAEALADGREPLAPWGARLVELEDDEIARHLEGAELLFALPAPPRTRRRRRRPTRH